MIRWPTSAGRAISRLFRQLQDVDVFVEDQGDEIFYGNLFSKVSGDGFVVKRVVALNGHESVKAAARAYTEARPAIFLIDGDLEWVRGEPPPQIHRLHRLECYCVENLLLEEDIAVDLCSEESACSNEDARSFVGFEGWVSSVSSLVDVFVRFAALNRVDASAPTVATGIGQVLLAQPKSLPVLSQDKVAALVVKLDAEIIGRVGQDAAAAAIREVSDRVGALGNPLHIVSGKDFLLPLLHFHVKHVTASAVSKRSFRHRMSLKCKPSHLQQLAAILRSAR